MNLGIVLKNWRWATKMDVRTAAKLFHISPATLSRIERGENCDGETLSNILIWLLCSDGVDEQQEITD